MIDIMVTLSNGMAFSHIRTILLPFMVRLALSDVKSVKLVKLQPQAH
jgi:hypothetical protein